MRKYCWKCDFNSVHRPLSNVTFEEWNLRKWCEMWSWFSRKISIVMWPSRNEKHGKISSKCWQRYACTPTNLIIEETRALRIGKQQIRTVCVGRHTYHSHRYYLGNITYTCTHSYLRSWKSSMDTVTTSKPSTTSGQHNLVAIQVHAYLISWTRLIFVHLQQQIQDNPQKTRLNHCKERKDTSCGRARIVKTE